MTVCVAAIAQHVPYPTVVACTDKMYTAADVTSEGIDGKRFWLAPNIVAFGAGDASDQLQICRLTAQRVEAEHIEGVGPVAQAFAEVYREYRQQAFERELLAPFGYTFKDYRDRHSELPPDFVARVDRLVRDGVLPLSGREFACSTIVGGVDTVSGPVPDYITAHLYVVGDPGQVSCHDTLGFAAVGSGARQAESFLMLERYRPDCTFDEATFTVYAAKRHAENAPFVGPSTDLIRIDNSGLGAAKPEDIVGIEKIYQRYLRTNNAATRRAKVRMAEFMEGLNAKSQATEVVEQKPTAGDALVGKGN